jgi:DNA-binding NarL/FixJ family response regulator
MTQPGIPLTVLIADDDPNVRAALRLVLTEDQAIGEVLDIGSAEELLQACLPARPRIVLLDVDLPGLRPEVLDTLRARLPGLKLFGMGASRDTDAAICRRLDSLIDKMSGAAGLRAAIGSQAGRSAEPGG